jgi:hypothetical protein
MELLLRIVDELAATKNCMKSYDDRRQRRRDSAARVPRGAPHGGELLQQ